MRTYSITSHYLKHKVTGRLVSFVRCPESNSHVFTFHEENFIPSPLFELTREQLESALRCVTKNAKNQIVKGYPGDTEKLGRLDIDSFKVVSVITTTTISD